MLQGCIFDSRDDQALEQFEDMLGGDENKEILDGFISQMENKITKTYRAKDIKGNYNMFLEDILNASTERIIQYDSLDCQLINGFENSKLANQYQYLKYDTVYFDGVIVTVDENGDEELEVVYNDSLQISERIKYLKEQGYPELIELGKLPSTLQSDELKNIEVREYYKNRNKACLPMFEDYIRTLYLQEPDYGNYIIKATLLYEIYLPDIVYNTRCD